MKVVLATAADEAWSRDLLRQVEDVAHSDVFREHDLVRDVEAADLILFVDAQQHPGDWSMRAFRRHPLVRRFPGRAYVYDERDHPRDLLPGIYVSMPRRHFDPRRQRAYGYFRVHADTRDLRDHAPDLLFSFRGRRSSRVRAEILDLRHPRAAVEDSTRHNFFSDHPSTSLAFAEERYRETLRRSKFVLCPRGSGTASFRLFETMAAGRVPVVLSDDWVAPEGIDWPSCSVRVPEEEVPSLVPLLEELEPDWPHLAQAAREAYDRWFAPEVWFHRVVELCGDLQGAHAPGVKRSFWLDRRVWRDGLRQAKVAISSKVG